MPRCISVFLLPILAVVLPVWPYNAEWSYGPALAVAFLLAANLLVVLIEYVGRRVDGPLPEDRSVTTDRAVTPGARPAKNVEAPEINPAGSAGNPVTGLG